MTKSGKKQHRIIREDIKDRQTSHWDLDYVSREELERLMNPVPEHKVEEQELEHLKPEQQD